MELEFNDIGLTSDTGQLLSSTLIRVDKNRMAQVIRNLFSNALKFTPRGGRITVTASHIYDSITYKNGSNSGILKLLRIEVKDTGAGISKVLKTYKTIILCIIYMYNLPINDIYLLKTLIRRILESYLQR